MAARVAVGARMTIDAAAIRAAVLAGIASDRIPGFSFTGHFQQLAWPLIGSDTTVVSMPEGPHLVDAHGEIDLTAQCVLFDAALATAPRLKLEPGVRLATTHLHVQFTGRRALGNLAVDAAYQGATIEGGIGQLLARGVLKSGGDVVSHCSGVFVRLPPPPGNAPLAPLPWQQSDQPAVPTLGPQDLDDRERAILAACDQALATRDDRRSFLQCFWGAPAMPTANGARCEIAVGPHMANRVGHVQGGILMGIAAETAIAAVPRHAMLSNLSAWFIGAGQGPALQCVSTVLHAGRSLAVVRTAITGSGGARILEAVSGHA